MTKQEKKLYHKKYREDTPEKLELIAKQYYKKNTEKIKLYHKQYDNNNPEKRKLMTKKYREDNPEKVKLYNKKYYKKNPDKHKHNQNKLKKENTYSSLRSEDLGIRYSRWSNIEDSKLLTMRDDGKEIKEIANILKRSNASIANRLRHLEKV